MKKDIIHIFPFLRKIKYNPEIIYIINEIDDIKQIQQCIDILFTQRKLKCHTDVNAFITVSDLIATKLSEELKLFGINVPQDIAITGFNNQLC